ncbi:MAG: MTH1187 family thiamine-binding protein [Deltaproteobacteria bacterium]|nr:MTH1187 family thiamine-binding protein [Deltaproteobacteria bacterium]
MALMHLTVIPLGTGSTSVGEYVADIQKALQKSGFNYELTDMGTIIEGSTEDLLKLAGQLAEKPFSKGVNRVVTQISLDDRRDKKVAIGAKKASVAARLQEMKGE